MRTPMSIAVFGSSLVSAYWNGAATYYRGLLSALARLGHRVTFFEPDAFERQAHRDIDDPPWAKVVVYPGDNEAAALRAVEQARGADLIVKASGVGVFDELLEGAVLALRSPRHLVAFLDVDAPATLERLEREPGAGLRRQVPHFDVIFTYGGGDPVVRAYQALGARACVPVYNALDPSTHHPVPRQARFISDLSLCANRLPDREARVEAFFFAGRAHVRSTRGAGAGRARGAGGSGPRRGCGRGGTSVKYVFLGLSVTSAWGNGHATTYRGLLRALSRRGHRVTFLERDVPWYADHRDLPAPEYCATHLYRDLQELERCYLGLVRDADVVVVGSYVPDGIEVARRVLALASGVTAFYDIDTPVTLAELDGDRSRYLSRALVPRFDLYLSFSGGPTLERLERQSARSWRGRSTARSTPSCITPSRATRSGAWAISARTATTARPRSRSCSCALRAGCPSPASWWLARSTRRRWAGQPT